LAGATARPSIAVLLPPSECDPVGAELRNGGFDPVFVHDAQELRAVAGVRRDIAVAIIDVESDAEVGSDAWAVLHESGRSIPALLVVNDAMLDQLNPEAEGHHDDEYLTRPYSAESIRWRMEAMCIRSVAVDDGSGPVLQSELEHEDWARRGQVLAVFNPKGGVGKTLVATNLAAALAGRGQRVLLIDADTVTGHVPSSLGMDAVPTVIDAWHDELDGGPVLAFDELASVHTSGLKVLPLAAKPIGTELLEPGRVASAVAVASRRMDFVIIDLHPSYSPLNRAMFDRADRILVPVTPDVPAIQATVKLRDVAQELGMRDRLALIANRANSGIKVDDLERAVAITLFGQVRSGGLLVVRCANEGRTLIELAPRERITADFDAMADQLLGVADESQARSSLRLFGRAIPSLA
jgi:MinD-like ATPase involved in chromosome partitioning or flagellar assembly